MISRTTSSPKLLAEGRAVLRRRRRRLLVRYRQLRRLSHLCARRAGGAREAGAPAGGARRTVVSPIPLDVVISAPVYIGQNVTIGEGARIGPYAVLGEGSKVGATRA